MTRANLPTLYEARSRELRFAFPDTVQTERVLCCFSYTGKRRSSNMVIIDVKMLSGFVPVKSTLDKVNYRSKISLVAPGQKRRLVMMKTEAWLRTIRPQTLRGVCMAAPSSLLGGGNTQTFAR